LDLSTRSSPPGVTRRNRFSPGIMEIFPRSSARFVAVSASVPAIVSSSLAISSARIAASRAAAPGLQQITSRSGASGSRTSLTCRFPATAW